MRRKRIIKQNNEVPNINNEKNGSIHSIVSSFGFDSWNIKVDKILYLLKNIYELFNIKSWYINEHGYSILGYAHIHIPIDIP